MYQLASGTRSVLDHVGVIVADQLQEAGLCAYRIAPVLTQELRLSSVEIFPQRLVDQ
jgi:hypothetical protein